MHHVPDHGLIAHGEHLLLFFQPARRVFHRSERFRQNFIQPFPLFLWVRNLGELFLPCRGLGAQFVVRQAFELLVKFVDPTHNRRQPLELALILRTKNFL